MDSAPKISDPFSGATSAMPGEFGRGLAHRMNPQVTVIRRAVVQPGFMARRSVAFSSYIGQSQVSRWSIGTAMNRGALTVRPPIDYWPWANPEEQAAPVVPQPERALPRMQQLRRRTDGQPGTMAKAMRPEVLDLQTISRTQAAPKQQPAPKLDSMSHLRALMERNKENLPAELADFGAAALSSDLSPDLLPGVSPAATARSTPGSARAWPGDSAASPRRATTSVPTSAPGSASAAPPRVANLSAATPTATPTATPGASIQRRGAFTPAQRPPISSARGPRPFIPATRSPVADPQSPAPALTDTVQASDLLSRIEAGRRTADASTSSPASAPPVSSDSRPGPADSASAAAPRTAAGVSADAPRADGGGTTSARAFETLAIDDAALAPAAVLRRTIDSPHVDSVTSPAPRGPASPSSVPPTPAGTEQATLQRFGLPLTGQQPLPARPPAATRPISDGTTARGSNTHDGHVALPRWSSDDSPSARLDATVQRTVAPRHSDERSPAAAKPSSTMRPSAAPPSATPPPATPPPDGTRSVPGLSPRGIHDLVAAPTTTVLTPAPPAVAEPSAQSRAVPDSSSVVLAAAPADDRGPVRTAERERSRQRPIATDRSNFNDTISSATREVLNRSRSSMSPATVNSQVPLAVARPEGRIDQTGAGARSLETVAPPRGGQATDLVQRAAVHDEPRTIWPTDPMAAAPQHLDFNGAATTTATATARADAPPTTIGAPTVPGAPGATARQAANRTPAVKPTTAKPTNIQRTHVPERPTADRFMDVLEAAPAPTLQPLPARFAPLARAVLGHTDVTVRHDGGSRAALAAVGKRAATTGNTIHLADQPTSAAATHILAHELTHVAHSSPAPRFFDDDRHSPEERQAEAVAHLIQRSPSLLSASPQATAAPLAHTVSPDGSLAPARTAAGAGDAAQCSLPGLLTPPPPRPVPSPSTRVPGAATAATRPLAVRRALADHRPAVGHSNNNDHASATTVVRRAVSSAPAARRQAASTSQAGQPTVVRRAISSDNSSAAASSSATAEGSRGNDATANLLSELDRTGGVVDFVDWIVEQVEDRVVAELHRRGGRFREDF